mgnify:CR=1 FL=1
MCKRLIEEIENEKIIVIVRGVERNKLIPIAEAMYRGGIKFLEITYSANGEVSDEETKENIRLLANHFGGRLHIGAGTVLTEKQAELTKQAGGEFVISPDTNPKVIKRTKELGMVSMPGALTPSEIQLAHISGADFVKLFPVSNLGIDYVRAVKAPLSHIRLLAVGGVDLSNIPGYLDIGVCGFGIGSNIVSGKLIGQNDYKTIEELAKKYVSAVK